MVKQVHRWVYRLTSLGNQHWVARCLPARPATWCCCLATTGRETAAGTGRLCRTIIGRPRTQQRARQGRQ
eukprot:scaffold1807_cov81-Phaeocystis_antarctica.AAC.1